MISVCAILPALNEADALPTALAGQPEGLRVIVVDNGSTDGTADLAREMGVEVVTENQPGYGAACTAGINAAAGAEILVFMDADATCLWSDLDDVLAPLLSGSADLVLGVRARPKREKGSMPIHVVIANAFLGRICGMLGGKAVSDIPPYRAISRSALNDLALTDRSFGWPLEMVLRAGQMKLRIQEVPVHYPRRVGDSKVTGTTLGTLRAVRRMTAVLWRYRRRKP